MLFKSAPYANLSVDIPFKRCTRNVSKHLVVNYGLILLVHLSTQLGLKIEEPF